MKKLDLTGQRFGNLIALKPDEPYIKPSGKKISTWLCQCDCGNTVVVRTEYLRSGHTKSCGCACGRIDIIGNRYGKLVVLEKIEGGKHLCQCDCGNTTIVETCNLKNGNTQSCGCLKSKGELKIISLLNELPFEYSTQYTFEDCIFESGRRASFDFAILDGGKLLCLIEYDGTQHYYGWNGQEGSLEQIQKRDKIKDKYCQEHNIRLVRIKYNQYDKLTKEVLEGLIKDDASAPDMEEAQEATE